MEAARVLSTASFAHTIKFLTVSGEEQGLVGSSKYVWSFYNNAPSKTLSRLVYQKGKKYNPDLQISTSLSTNQNSDHASFWMAGISATGVYECVSNPYYHSANDLPGYANIGQITALARRLLLPF